MFFIRFQERSSVANFRPHSLMPAPSRLQIAATVQVSSGTKMVMPIVASNHAIVVEPKPLMRGHSNPLALFLTKLIASKKFVKA